MNDVGDHAGLISIKIIFNKLVGCHSERQFSFSNGDNGWGWGGVLCIVFYVCLLVLYLLYIIIILMFSVPRKLPHC